MTTTFSPKLQLTHRLASLAAAVVVTFSLCQQTSNLGAPERSAALARATLARGAAPATLEVAASQPDRLVVATAAR